MFIHIATIVVGLVIAIGLEQTLEAIHEHHERTKLLATFVKKRRAARVISTPMKAPSSVLETGSKNVSARR
jgi:hypothetical protein